MANRLGLSCTSPTARRSEQAFWAWMAGRARCHPGTLESSVQQPRALAKKELRSQEHFGEIVAQEQLLHLHRVDARKADVPGPAAFSNFRNVRGIPPGLLVRVRELGAWAAKLDPAHRRLLAVRQQYRLRRLISMLSWHTTDLHGQKGVEPWLVLHRRMLKHTTLLLRSSLESTPPRSAAMLSNPFALQGTEVHVCQKEIHWHVTRREEWRRLEIQCRCHPLAVDC